MSDRDYKAPKARVRAEREPAVGEGLRSLSNWQRLHEMRQGLSDTADARESLMADPAAFLARYGIDGEAFLGREGLAAKDLDARLLYTGNLERDNLGTHRAASLTVGPVALAVAFVGGAVWAGAVAAEVAAVACDVWVEGCDTPPLSGFGAADQGAARSPKKKP